MAKVSPEIKRAVKRANEEAKLDAQKREQKQALSRLKQHKQDTLNKIDEYAVAYLARLEEYGEDHIYTQLRAMVLTIMEVSVEAMTLQEEFLETLQDVGNIAASIKATNKLIDETTRTTVSFSGNLTVAVVKRAMRKMKRMLKGFQKMNENMKKWIEEMNVGNRLRRKDTDGTIPQFGPLAQKALERAGGAGIVKKVKDDKSDGQGTDDDAPTPPPFGN